MLFQSSFLFDRLLNLPPFLTAHPTQPGPPDLSDSDARWEFDQVAISADWWEFLAVVATFSYRIERVKEFDSYP